MSKIIHRAANLETLGPREFEGIAATSELQIDGYALDMAGADLSRFKNGRGPILFNHDSAAIIGTVTSIRTTSTTIPFRGRLATAGVSKLADEVGGLLKDGIASNLSAGFEIQEAEPINAGRPRDGMRAIKWTLYEISVVAVNLDPNAVVTARAHRGQTHEFTGAGNLSGALLGALGRRQERGPLCDDPLAITAWERWGEQLTPGRVAQIRAEARQIGQRPEYRLEWLHMVSDVVNEPVDDYERRQQTLRRLRDAGDK